MTQRRYILAVTGASGACYGIALAQALLARPLTLHLVVSAAGRQVLAHETELGATPLERYLEENTPRRHPEARLIAHRPDDLFAPPASGSFRHQGMIVAPCSMKTLAATAAGLAADLIHRAADVALKEKRPLILVPRETPLSPIHLANMLRLAECGATILPACPGFYHRPEAIPQLIDSVTARILDHLGLEQHLVAQWGI